jgi:hypothetical protein
MKYLTIVLLFICSLSFGQTNRSRTYTVIVKSDANVLPNTIPPRDTAVVFTYRVYGINKQYIYYWHMGQPSGDSTASYMAQHYIIIPSSQTRGYWTTVDTPVDASMVIGLIKAINDQIAAKGLKALIVGGALNYDSSSGLLTSNSYSKAQSDSISAQQNAAINNIQLTPGPAGAKGDKGDKGDIGPTGTKGDQGATGLKGDTGAQGVTGQTGPAGATGLPGAQGIQGVKGDTGAQGIQGPIGATGLTGAQGVQGVKGDTGQQGTAGTPATPNTASMPLSISGNNISIQASSATQPGALSASDYTTFSNKVSATALSAETAARQTADGAKQDTATVTAKVLSILNTNSFVRRTDLSAINSLSYNPATGVFSYTQPTNVSSFTNNVGYDLQTRATGAEGALSLRQVQDSTRLVDEISRATTAESGKEPVIVQGTTTQYWRGDKTWQTLPIYTVAALANGGITVGQSGNTYNISQTTPSYNNSPGRTIGTSYRISTVRPARVSYTVSATTGLSLLNLNSSAVVYLEISADNATWLTINSAGVTRTLAVSISVGINDTSNFNIQGEVPTNYYCRLRAVLSGGGTATFMSGQEVTY